MKIKALLAAGAMAAFVAAPFAANADSASATASATVAAPLTISKQADLSFGVIAPTGAPGTVTISTAGARTSSAVDLLSGGSTSAASFDIAGEGTSSYSITIPATATLTGSGDDMIATLSDDAPGSPALSGGAATVNIGAELAVGASQAAGAYSGTFSVTVSYN